MTNQRITLKEALELLEQQRLEEEARQKARLQRVVDERKAALQPVREELAELCHEQWSGWMQYLFSKAPINDDGTWTMPAEFVERWQRQMNTPYSDLSSPEQDSDRTEADKFISVIEVWVL